MELLKAGRGAALGRNIRPVDDDVLSHPFIEPPPACWNGAIRPRSQMFVRLACNL